MNIPVPLRALSVRLTLVMTLATMVATAWPAAAGSTSEVDPDRCVFVGDHYICVG